MKKTFKGALIAFAAMAVMTLSGCSEQVPPGHKGKILGKNGYNPELLSEGRHTVLGRDRLVLLDLTTNRHTIPLKVTMRDYTSDGKAKAGLDMDFELSYRFRLRDDRQIINAMFNDIKVDPKAGVTANAVVGIYATPVIQTVFRDILSQYEPEEALSNRALINQELGKALQARLAKSPIEVSDIMVTQMTLPGTIVKRIESNKNKELQIAESEAQQAIDLLEKENSIILANKQAEKDLIDAQAAAAQNAELQKGLDSRVLELRRLEIAKIQAEAFAKRMETANAGDVVFMPYDALNTVGGQTRMLTAK